MMKTLMKRISNEKMLTAAVLIAAVSIFLRICARTVTGFADAWHSIMTTPSVLLLGHISNLVPFSLVEALIILLLTGLVVFLLRTVICLIRKRPVRTSFFRGCRVILLLASVIFLLYEGGEDVYFYCTPFSETYGFGNGSYTTEELADVCSMLVDRCNEEAALVSRDDNGLMINNAALSDRVVAEMQQLGSTYPVFSGYYSRPKGLGLSILMSETNMTGIYSAYTREANYNRLMPAYNTAFTMCHELSHLKGVLPENEANFAAYLACRDSTDHDIAYSGAMLGWVYCGNELYKRDRTLWQSIASGLCDSVNLDLNYNTAYWNQYRSQVSEAAQNFNDAYLKQAGQSDGVESYNRVVDLIVSRETTP